MRRNLLLLFFLALLGLMSCFPKKSIDPPVKKVWGYKPVFSNDSNILRISADTARAVKNAGKIYAFNNLILQSELYEGIHVLDRTDPNRIKNLGFLRVKGNTEIAVKGNHLYVNSYSDLVIIDVSNWQNPLEIKRIKNAFPQAGSIGGYFIPPPERGVYYDCSKNMVGLHTGWVRDSVDNTCIYR